MLQSLAVSEVKSIADSLLDKDGNPTAGSETVRAALQAITGCAGSAAGGSGGCSSAAAGAAASVVINYLLTEFVDPAPKDAVTGEEEARSLEDQEARKNLVTTIIAGIAGAAGIDATAATTAAQIETENNDLKLSDGSTERVCVAGTTCKGATLDDLRDSNDPEENARYEKFLETYGTHQKAEEAIAAESERQRIALALSQITAGDILLFGGDEERLRLALEQGYTLEEIRAPGSQVAAAFAGPLYGDGTGQGYFFAPDHPLTGEFTLGTRLAVLESYQFVDDLFVNNLGDGTLLGTYLIDPVGNGLNIVYQNTLGPGTAYDLVIVKPFYSILGSVADVPLLDPGVIATLESSGIPIGRTTGAGLGAIKYLSNIARGVATGSRVGAADDIVVTLGSASTASRSAQIGNGKFDFMFGRVTSNTHNTARSQQLQQELARVGIHNTSSGRRIIANHLDDVVSDPTNITGTFTKTIDGKILNFETRQSLFSGPGGFLQLNSTFRINADGTRSLSTIIPKRGN